MTEKTLVEIFNEVMNTKVIGLFAGGLPADYIRVATEKALEAVIEVHESRKWQPLPTPKQESEP